MSKQGQQGQQDQRDHMTAKEYRIMMGLDPVEGTAQVVVEETTDKVFNPATGPRRVALRLIWLIGWAWMIFTFGWIGHIIANLTQKELKK